MWEGGVPLYAKDSLRYTGHYFWMNDGPVKSLCVRISGQTHTNDIVDICHRPPNQEKEVNEAFLKHLEEISPSQAFILTCNFNDCSICCLFNRAGQKQPRRHLQCWEKKKNAGDQPDNMGDVLLYLMLTNKKKLVRVIKKLLPQWLSLKTCEKRQAAESQSWIEGKLILFEESAWLDPHPWKTKEARPTFSNTVTVHSNVQKAEHMCLKAEGNIGPMTMTVCM